jgi:hypothetical protein
MICFCDSALQARIEVREEVTEAYKLSWPPGG